MEEDIKRVVTLLRKRAEEILKSRPEGGETLHSESEILKLLHELEVYSVELELQNEELQKGLTNPEEKKYKLSEAQVLQLVHELEVHQLELEMQNRELEYSKSVSQDVAERYSDLFGFSPAGYVILSPKGEIIDLNWTAARIIGKDRLTLKNALFVSFISESLQPVFGTFLKSVFKEKTKKSCDISFPTYDAGVVFANITGILTQSEQQCLLTLTDTTDRIQSEKFRKIKQEILSILHGEPDSQDMINRSLAVLKTSSGFDAVALRVQSGNEFPLVAHAGLGEELIITENSLPGPDEAGKVYIDESGSPVFECGCGMTIGLTSGQPGVCESAGGSWWVNNMVALPGAAAGAVPHPQQGCMHRTYNSMAMIPVRGQRGQSSYLQLSCIHKHCFTPVIIDILEEIAGHLGDALVCRKKEEALQAAKGLLQKVTESIPYIFMQVDKDGTVSYINHELHGPGHEVTVGKYFADWVLPQYQGPINQALGRVFAEGATEVLEVRERYKKGAFRWHKITLSPVKSGDEVIYAIMVSQDITQIKSVEDRQRENEQRLTAILDTAMDGFIVFDRNGRILDVNKTYCRQSGYTRRELLSMHLTDIEYVMNAEQINEAIEEVARIGEVRFETKHRRKDGSPVDVEISATYRSLHKEHFISFVHDISKRKQREELMAKSNELYRLLFENSGDAILIREAGGGVISANPVACKMLGRTEEEAKGLTRDKIFDLNDLRVARAFEERDKKGKFKGELTFLRKDGTTLPVEVTTTKFSDAEGKEMVCIFARDISERKQAEEKLREQQELMSKAEEISHLSSWSLDLVTNTLVWSNEAYRICGVPVGYADMTYEFFLSVVHPDDREAVDNAYSGSIREGRDTYEIQHRLIRQDTGEIRSIHEKCEHYRDASGKIVRSVGMMYDITEQKQAQEKLRQSEERYKSIFEDSRSVMLLIDPGTSRIMDANPAACNYYGWPHDVICSMNIDQINLLSKQEVEAEMKLAVKEHRNQFFFRHRLASGEDRDVEVYSAPVQVDDKKMLFSIVHDITERRIAEEALKKSKDNLRAILDATKESIFVFDKKGILVDANETAASRLHKSLNGIIRKHISEVFPSDISASRWQQFINVFKSGKPVKFEDSRADFIFENNIFPVFENGKVSSVVSYSRDITESRRNEADLRESKERFQLALNNSPVAVAIQDNNYIYQWSYNVASIPSEKLVGKTDADMFPPEEAELMMDYKRRVVEQGTTENYQAWIQLGNGQYFFNIHYKPLRNAEGEITGIGMSAIDLTEQKLAEQALHQYIKSQEILAEASTQLLGLVSIQEVMQFGVEQIYQMAGNSIVVMSEYSHDHSMVNIKTIAGDQDKLEKLNAMLGRPLQQISFPTAPNIHQQMSGRGLLQLDLGLHELSQGQIPEELSSQIESEIGFASSYVMPLLVENDLIGSLFITTDYPQELQNKHLIETFIKQLSLSLRNKRVEQALLESRLELETALSSMSDAILITDNEGNFINFNDAFAHLLRFRDKAECARHFNDYPDLIEVHYLDGIEVPLDRWPVQRALRGETATNVEHHVRRKDTGESWVESYSFSPICNYEGDIMGCVLVGRDITEKILAEETLKANKRILDAVFNGVTETIMMLDIEGKILTANETAAKRWNLSIEDVLGRHVSEFITKESQNKIPAQLKDMIESAMPVHFEDQRGDREYDLTFYPIIEPSGEIRQYVVFNRDITEQKRAERALYESEKKLSNLIFDMQVGIVLNDVKPGVLMSNPKALELLGITGEQLLGKAAFDPEWKAIHEDGSPFPSGSQPVIWSVPSGDPIKNVVMGVYRPATHDWVWLMVDAVPHTDDAGNIYQVVYSFMDITSLKTAQNELKASEEKFRSLVYDMQVGLVLNSNRGDIILSNPKAAELLGMTENQLLGKTPADPDWMPIHEDGSPFPGEDHPLSVVIKTGKPVRNVVMGVFHPQKKEHVWLLVNSQPQLDKDGSVQQVVTSFVDITQQKNIERIVRESEQRLQYHFENSPLAIVEWDNNSVIKEWSIEAERIFGWKKEEVIGMQVDGPDMVYTEDAPMVEDVMSRLYSGKENIVVSNNRNLTKSGNVIDCIWYNSVLLDEQGKISSVMSLVQDVTRQKQAEQALIKSEEKFSLIFEKSPYAITLINMSNGRIEDVNEAFETIYGYKVDEVIGKKADKLGMFTDNKDAIIREIKQKGFVHDVEYENIKKTGENCILRYNIDIVESSGQKYYIHRAEDITTRKRNEQELREREYFFRESQQAAFIGSYKADFKSGFWESSEVLDRIFGIDKNYVRSIQGWLDMLHPADRDKMKHFLLKEVYKKDAVFNNEFRIIRKNDGETRWVHGVGRIDFDANNKIKSLLGTIQDITERKQREEKLRKLNQTLAALSKSSVAITQASDEEEYLKQICKIVVEDTDFSMAWIGFIDEKDASRTVKPVASAGFKDDYLQTIKLIWEDSEHGQGPTGIAIRTGKPSMCNDMENDPSFAPWREQALKRGFASSIAFPLKTGDAVFGVISIYSKESNVFNDDVEISLLTELANDLAHGINTIRLRASHRLAEEALSRSHSELEVLVKERTRELQITNELLKKEIVVRKQQEKTLHQAEEKYRTVANFAANWEFWIDPKGIMIYCSPSCERITGYKVSEFVENNQLIYNIIHPDDLEMYWKHVKTELDSVLHEHEFQFRIIRKDGLVRWLGHYCQPIFDDAGNFKGTRGSNKDITARRKMESMLVTSNQKYRLLSENISDGIFICKNGKFEYVNKAVCTILGYKRKELERMKLTQVVMSDYNEQLETILYSKEPVNHSRNLEVECLKKDLSVIFVEILLNYVAEEKTVYGVIQDITERKQLHKSIVKAIIETEENEKAHFSKELHDGLGPLLSTIKLYLQWSARAKSNESRDEIIHKAEEILEESLTTVREVSNKLSPHLLTNYGLNSAIKSFVDKLQATSAINIQYEGEFNRRLEVEVEAALYRATIECINNSIKHANAKNIRITLKDVAGRIYLTYTDDGEGFDVSKTLTTKKGLGLFNMQNRIQNIGGKVSIWSEPGRGVHYEFVVNA